jgi:hypothetical protein
MRMYEQLYDACLSKEHLFHCLAFLVATTRKRDPTSERWRDRCDTLGLNETRSNFINHLNMV